MTKVEKKRRSNMLSLLGKWIAKKKNSKAIMSENNKKETFQDRKHAYKSRLVA